jgi:hypothetical protein
MCVCVCVYNCVQMWVCAGLESTPPALAKMTDSQERGPPEALALRNYDPATDADAVRRFNEAMFPVPYSERLRTAATFPGGQLSCVGGVPGLVFFLYFGNLKKKKKKIF